MSNSINLILSSEDFFDAIKFQTLTDIEQVGCALFYITEVACLRKDMIPIIIADRIQDQYEFFFQRNPSAAREAREDYKPLTAKDVESILENNPDWFMKITSGTFRGSDRKPRMKAFPYRLTQAKIKELDNRFGFDRDVKGRITLKKKKLFLDGFLLTLLFLSIIVLSVLFGFSQLRSKDDDFVVASVKDYANKTKFEERSPSKKSVLFVYYVTELTQIRKEVNATAIHDRIVDLGYDMPNQETLNNLLYHSEMLKSDDGNTYSLTDLGKDFSEDVVLTHIKKLNGYTISKELVWTLFSCLMGIIGFIIKVSYDFGKKQ